MTTFIQAVLATDALAEQLQGFVQNPRYLPRFFDTLFGLRTALGSARERFVSKHDDERADKPIFATILDRCTDATSFGASLAPDDAAVSRYASAVQRAITALQGEQGVVTATRPGLRGTLRIQSAQPERATFRPIEPTAADEPYYASLVKLFPVEAVTLYPLAIGIAGNDAAIRLLLIGVISVFIIVLRWFGTQEESGGDADMLAIFVAVISFELYVGSMGGFGFLPGGPEQTRQLLAFITIIWVTLIPIVLRRARL